MSELTIEERAAIRRGIAEIEGKTSQKALRRSAERILGLPEGSLDAKKAAIKELCVEELNRLETRGERLNQLLHDAAEAGDVVKLRELIAAGADVDARLPIKTSGGPRLDWTPLCCVVSAGKVKLNRREKGRTACVRALLDAGASASEAVVRYDNEEVHRSAFAAMHDAAYSGFATICRLLLDAGEDLNVLTSGDFTPLRYAAVHKHHRLVVLLLSRGAATDDECTRALEEYSPGYLLRIERAGGFAKYQKQQRAKLVASLAPKMSHLLPPELVSHVITFWGHLGWN